MLLILSSVALSFDSTCFLRNLRLRKEELSAISGPNEFAEFYNRLKQIKEFHRKHPNEVSGPALCVGKRDVGCKKCLGGYPCCGEGRDALWHPAPFAPRSTWNLKVVSADLAGDIQSICFLKLLVFLILRLLPQATQIPQPWLFSTL